MAMVVRSNIMAMNANRSLGMNNSSVSKNLEKLSSGFRINRAGDDASGLAISEKMKAQIKGLETASANSQDGISLVQTAEGALTEVHDMLNRMVELAGKSANGTMDSTVDRAALQEEVNSLVSEINRVSQGTNFNGIKLLDGSLSSTGASSAVSSINTSLTTTKVPATKGDYTSDSLSGTSATTAVSDGESLSFTVGLDNGKSYTIELFVKKDATGNAGKLVDANGKEYGAIADTSGTGSITGAEATSAFIAAFKDTGLANDFDIAAGGLNSDAIKLTAKEAGTGAPKVTSFGESKTVASLNGLETTAAEQKVTTVAAEDVKFNIANGAVTGFDGTNEENAVFTINGKKFALLGFGGTADKLASDVTALTGNLYDTANLQLISQQTGLTVEADGTTGIILSAGTATTTPGGGLTLQIGDTAESFNQVTVNVADMSSKGLGIANLSVATETDARAALTLLRGDLAAGGTVRGAINVVSDNRAAMGALQNRLEHTINNLDVAAENMTSANSRIRDTDMAKQMMEYTKSNVLTQAAQAMLAQANQQPQSILQLLQ